MAKRGKKYQEVFNKVDRNKFYGIEEAVSLALETAPANFDETIDFAAKLGVNPKHADQQVRGTVVLPHGTGKEVTVLVFAKGEKIKEAEEAGADYVGGPELAQKIEGGWMDFDVAIATPDMMGVVGKLGKVLGPKGLMPNPKAGTVTFEISKAVNDVKAGKIEYRVDKTSIVHVPIGKKSFGTEKLVENLNTVLDALVKARPASAKGQYMRSVVLSSTMGPGIKINPQLVAKK